MRIRINKKRAISIYIYIYLFIIFYFPKVSGSNSVFLSQPVFLGVIAMGIVPYLIRNNNIYSDIIMSKRIWNYCTLIAFAAIYYLFRYTITVKQFALVDSRLLQNIYPIIIVINMMYIMILMRKCGFSRSQGIDVVINLASFQGVISILMLLWSPLKEVANSLYLNYATQFSQGDYILTTRLYGISSDYTYGMPIIHGLLCGISLYLGFEKSRKYIIQAMLIFINVFLNSRTGVLVAILCIVVSFFFYFRKNKVSKYSIIVVLLLPIVLIAWGVYIEKYQENIFKFVSVLFVEIYMFFFKQETVGTINYLVDTNFYFPKGIALMFGAGHRVYGAEALLYGYLPTDVGIVNDMFMGGLVYIGIRYGAMIKLILQTGKLMTNKILVVSMFIAWIVADIKGQVTVNSIIISTYIFLIFCIVFLRDEVKSNG